METPRDDIIARIRERIATGKPIEALAGAPDTLERLLPKPASLGELDTAERALGLQLPALLRRLYTDIANGGFGPGYGLIGVPPDGATDDLGQNLVSLYTSYRERDPADPHWRWPVGLLPVAHLGCAMYACVDCTVQGSAVIWFEPNPHDDGTPWDECFIPLADSLETWLGGWLDGRDLLMAVANANEHV